MQISQPTCDGQNTTTQKQEGPLGFILTLEAHSKRTTNHKRKFCCAQLPQLIGTKACDKTTAPQRFNTPFSFRCEMPIWMTRNVVERNRNECFRQTLLKVRGTDTDASVCQDKFRSVLTPQLSLCFPFQLHPFMKKLRRGLPQDISFEPHRFPMLVPPAPWLDVWQGAFFLSQGKLAFSLAWKLGRGVRWLWF